jgi:hypothetical protein
MYSLASLLVATLLAAPASPQGVRITAIPEATVALRKGGGVFTSWLERQTGLRAQLRVAATYEDAVRALGSGDAELG